MSDVKKKWTPAQQKAARAKWVAALRSGKYKQGTNRLRSANDEFCCLGVACEVAAEEGIIGPARLVENVSEPGYAYGAQGNEAFLPYEVAQWLGLEGISGQLKEPAVQNASPYGGTRKAYQLTQVNDSFRWSFDKIADVIESDKVATAEEPRLAEQSF